MCRNDSQKKAIEISFATSSDTRWKWLFLSVDHTARRVVSVSRDVCRQLFCEDGTADRTQKANILGCKRVIACRFNASFAP